MKQIILTTVLLSSATNLLAQGIIQKCDREVLLCTSQKIGSLDQQEILNFLMTFGKECRNNVEYSEWSNELLFKILDQQTELTIKTIEREQSKIEFEEVLIDLSSPINDGINVKALIPKIEKAKGNGQLKRKIIDRLKEVEY